MRLVRFTGPPDERRRGAGARPPRRGGLSRRLPAFGPAGSDRRDRLCPRARKLYDRLGYTAYDRALESWDEQAPDGTTTRYETMCTLMRKELDDDNCFSDGGG